MLANLIVSSKRSISKFIFSAYFLSSIMLLLFFSFNSYADTTSIKTVSTVAPASASVATLSITGGGSTSTGGGSGTAVPDLFTGTLSYSIPIEVAPGRKGMAPSLALEYRSTGANGWVGVGWDLEVGSIARSTKNGVNYSGDEYVLQIGGSTIDLVHIAVDEFNRILNNSNYDEYRSKIENSFSRIRKYKDTAGKILYWEVTDKSGTRYLYGQLPGTRQDDPADENRIFKWCLDHVEDTNGNYMNVIYDKTPFNTPYQGEIYLKQIDYTGNLIQGRTPTNYVHFYLESRTDAPVMFTTNFGIKTAYRLKTIEVRGNGNFVRAYKLTYASSTSTLRSILGSLQQFGNDAVIDMSSGNIQNENSASKLPALDFTYNSNIGFQSYTNWGSGHLDSDQLGDFNGDGKSDVIQFHTNGNAYVWLSNVTGDGFLPYTNWGSGHIASDKLGDFNGDGKTDVIQFYNGNANVWLSTGSGFLPYTNWGSGHLDSDQLGDFNGDGKSDVIQFHANGNAYVWLSNVTGDGFLPYTNWGSGHIASDKPGDFNGDGKTDVIQFYNGNASVWLSTGSGFLPYTNWGSGHLDSDQLGDFNGDGKTDVIQFYNGNASVWLSTGSGFQPYTNWSSGHSASDKLGDFNGDGKTDVIQFYDGNASVWLSNGPASDLLSSISTGLGSTTTIEYKPSTQYLGPQLQLPIPIQTVYSVTTNDGTGNIATTTYDYKGGYYHIGEKDFRGFNHVTVKSLDENGKGTITETWFHQGDETTIIPENATAEDLKTLASVETGFMKGQPYRTRTSDELGRIYSEATTIHRTDDSAPYFTPAIQMDGYACEAAIGSCETNPLARHVKTIVTFDWRGNILREDHYGDLADSTDDTSNIKSYTDNPDLWILGLPTAATVFQGTYPGVDPANFDPNKKVSGSTFYYDGVNDYDCNIASTNQYPTKGNTTRVVRWYKEKQPGTNDPEVRMAYDPYGNLSCTRDANSNLPATITYDSTFTFAKIATNALGHRTETQYCGVDDAPTDNCLYGQVTSVKDPNLTTSTIEYDTFGRRVKATAPDGSWAATAYINFGRLDTTIDSQHVYSTTSAGASSWTYFDGFGRTTIAKSKATQAGRIIASKTEYNKNGTVKRSTLPYFDGAETPRWKTFTYDSLGRVIRADNVDGTWVLSCYDTGVTVAIGVLSTQKPTGHRKRETKNAQGKLIKVEEYEGEYADCSVAMLIPYATTTYEYDVLRNLVKVKDAKLNETIMAYDSLGRKKSMHDPDMGDWTYTYDANGNLKTQTDAKGQIITFFYDELNRVTRKDYPTGTDVIYTYGNDPAMYNKGRLITMTDASGTTQYTYDMLGRSKDVTKTVDGTPYITSTTYDEAGRTKTITYPQSSGTVTYNYDADGNLANVTGTGETNPYIQYSGYNALRQPRDVMYGNGVTTTYEYDTSSSLLKNILTASPVSGPVINLTYGFDNNGNVSSLTDGINMDRSQTFDYDPLNRLIGAHSASYGDLSYSYDQIGNILSKEGVDYTYSKINAGPHAVTGTSDGKTYIYDNNGNMISESGPADFARSMTFDYDNMPQSITLNSVTTSFVYDGAGARVKKVTGSDTAVYIGKLYECNSAGCSKYIFAGSTRIALITPTDTLYYHQDHLGSSSVITDSTGAKREDIAYYPFGATRLDTGDISVNHKYTSQEFDAQTGLYYYNARYYNPVLGRFISPDSIVPNFRDPQSLNRYSYVRNNPLIYTDPSGHHFWKKVFKHVVRFAVNPYWGWKVANDQLLMRYPQLAMVEGAAATILGSGLGSAAFSAYTTNLYGGHFSDILKSVAIGAVSGAVGTKIGNLTGSTVFSGMASGATGSALTGQNLLKGAITGGITAAAMAYIAPAVMDFLGTDVGGPSGRVDASMNEDPNGTTYTNPTGGDIRSCDGQGCGDWGASREGGTRDHFGIDIISEPGQDVVAAHDGIAKVSKYSQPGVDVQGSDHYSRSLYVQPSKAIVEAGAAGLAVKAGAVIGTAMNIKGTIYSPNITNHVHQELYGYSPWRPINPTPFFFPR